MENNLIHFELCPKQHSIYMKQGDFGSREVTFTLKRNGEKYTPEEGEKVLVSLKRGDGKTISYLSGTEHSPVKINGAEVTFSVTKWMTELSGSVFFEVSLLKDNSKITSETAALRVSKALRTDEDYEEDESSDILIELISQTAALAEDIDRKAQNAQEVADAVKLAYDNGEFKLRYEDMTPEQKKEMFESLPAIDPDDLDLYQDPETNFVYLVYKGIRSANGIPLAANGGGGAAANNAVMVVTNETGWQYKAVAQNADCFLSLKWSSLEEGLETGDGSVVVRVDGSLKYSANCRQGTVSLNVKEYLSGGSNTVKITISDVYGNSKTVTFTINVVVLTVSSTFDSSVAYSGPINYFYTPTGQAEKTVHFVLDNVEIGTQSVTESARQQSYIIPAQSHGSHTLLVFFTAMIDGELVASNGLFYDLICTEQNNENDIIVSDFQSASGEQFISFSVPFIVYSPSSLTTDVEIYINDELYQTLRSVDRTKQLFTYMPEEAGELNVKFKTATAEKSFTLDIAETSITVQAVTNNLSLYLTAYGRSNSEEHPEEWKDERNNISALLENFNFISDGWQSDEEKNTCLRITGGARVTVPYKMFDKDFRTEGKTIEFEFSTKEILNYDTEIINCMSGGRGFVVTPQYARLVSEQSEIDTQYKEDEHIRLAFVIEKRANNRLILMYLDGVMCGAAQYPANDNFQQVNPVDIVIGSSECTVDLYNIRVYDNDLTRFQILENWIADTQSGELKKARWERNDVYDAYGSLVISKLPKYLPYLTVTAPVLPQYKGDKKTVEVEFEDQQDANNSFVAQGVQWDVQGTSSQYYYKKNFKGKYKKGFNINGTQSATYAMRDDSIPTSTFTYKADVASSEGANNVELVRLFNDSLPYKTPPMRSDSRVRVGIDGFPIVMFHNNGSGAKFYGKMNFNNDKSSGEIFGFKSGDEFWSVENNTSRRCLYKTAEGTDEEWLSDFAGEYPEDNTDTANLKKVCEWIVSTCRENATGDELTEPVAYGEKTFTHDTEEYRLEKFRNELEEHFNLDSCIYYYLFTELFLMIDSRAKNSMMTYFAEEDKWYWFAYDMDTAIGINNEGKLAYDYNLEDTDTVNGDDVFNGQKSTFWMNLKDAFGDKFAEMYQRMRSGLITYAEVERRFEEHQSKWSEAVFNEDSYVKCLEPLILNKDATYIPMLQGSKAGQRKWWLYNRFKYMDSKYMKGDVLSDYINIRAYGTADFDITPYADIYVSASFDGKPVQARARRGEVTHLENPLDDANDAVIAVYSASQLKDIGDLSGLKPKLLDVSSAVKLQRLKIGDNAEGYVNEQLTELTIGNNNLIKSIDVRNCVNLGTDTQKTVDVSGCRNVEELYFENTAINGIELPNGGVLKVLHLPRTISNLSILNQTALIDFELESSENVTSLRVENSPIDTKEIVEGMPFGSRIRLLGVDWTFESFGEMEDMMNLLDTMKGLDEHGYNLEEVQLTGTWRIHSLTTAQLKEVRERYSWINVIYDELIRTVVFQNYDGAFLCAVAVADGTLCAEPIESGLINKPTKPVPGFGFDRWDYDLSQPITADMTITACFVEINYNVTFMSGGEVLKTYSVPALSSVEYDGEEPKSTEPDEMFWAWDKEAFEVTDDMVINAVYVKGSLCTSGNPNNGYYYIDNGTKTVYLFNNKEGGGACTGNPYSEEKPDLENVIVKSGVTSLGANLISALGNRKLLKLPSTIKVNQGIDTAQNMDYEVIDVDDVRWWGSLTNRNGSDAWAPRIKEGGKLLENGVEVTWTVSVPYSGNIGNFARSKISGLVIEGGEKVYDNYCMSCETLESVEIKEPVVNINGNAFKGCTALKNLILPETMVSAGTQAFSGCLSLESFNVPENFIKYDYECFSSCKSLKSFEFPKSTTAVARSMFYYGESLTKTVIPESVTTINQDAFMGCFNLGEVIILPSTLTIASQAFLRQYPFSVKCVPLIMRLPNATIDANGAPSVTIGGSCISLNGGKIIFATQEIAEGYKKATNWSAYAAYITHEGAEDL